MKRNLLTQLEDLERKIQTASISMEARNIKEWGGADVIIKKTLDENTQKWRGDQPLVMSFQNTQPRRRAVITEYSKELSWLFYELRNLFSKRIDYVSKYDFYGLLAQSAIDYLRNNEELQDAKGLLFAVINTAKGFCKDEPSI